MSTQYFCDRCGTKWEKDMDVIPYQICAKPESTPETDGADYSIEFNSIDLCQPCAKTIGVACKRLSKKSSARRPMTDPLVPTDSELMEAYAGSIRINEASTVANNGYLGHLTIAADEDAARQAILSRFTALRVELETVKSQRDALAAALDGLYNKGWTQDAMEAAKAALTLTRKGSA